MSKAICLDSVVTMQYGHESETCLVFLSESSSFKICRTFVETGAMANNVRVPSSGCRKELIATKARWNGEAPIQWTDPPKYGAVGALNTWKQTSSGLKRR